MAAKQPCHPFLGSRGSSVAPHSVAPRLSHLKVRDTVVTESVRCIPQTAVHICIGAKVSIFLKMGYPVTSEHPSAKIRPLTRSSTNGLSGSSCAFDNYSMELSGTPRGRRPRYCARRDRLVAQTQGAGTGVVGREHYDRNDFQAAACRLTPSRNGRRRQSLIRRYVHLGEPAATPSPIWRFLITCAN